MGCGPSKNANVATDSTVKSKSLLKNNSNESSNAKPSLLSTTTAVATNVVTEKAEVVPTDEDTKAGAAKEEEEEEAKGNEDVGVKDVTPSTPTMPEEEEEGKFVDSGSSPDRYFSSRKDEEAVAGVTDYLPVPEIVDGETVEIVSATAANAKEAEAEKVDLDGSTGGQGKTSSMDSADFKEAVFVEEEEAAELMETEEKNASMSS